jgi:pilus assembly protein Flp/PilA
VRRTFGLAAERRTSRERRYLNDMAALMDKLSAAVRREEGQGLAEYALILALIAIVVIAAVIFLGGQINTIMSTVGTSI